MFQNLRTPKTTARKSPPPCPMIPKRKPSPFARLQRPLQPPPLQPPPLLPWPSRQTFHLPLQPVTVATSWTRAAPPATTPRSPSSRRPTPPCNKAWLMRRGKTFKYYFSSSFSFINFSPIFQNPENSIEITPGLVIRNPNHNRQKKTVPEPSPMKTPKRALERNLGSPSPALLPQRMLTPALGTPHSAMKRKLINPPSSLMRKGGPKKTLEPEQNDGGDDDECPETPQLRTVSIHKMREEQRRKEEAEQKKRDEEQKRKNLAQIMSMYFFPPLFCFPCLFAFSVNFFFAFH